MTAVPGKNMLFLEDFGIYAISEQQFLMNEHAGGSYIHLTTPYLVLVSQSLIIFSNL